jgi:copper(I)-binding protein
VNVKEDVMKLAATVLIGSMLFASSAMAATDTPTLMSAAGLVVSIDGSANSLVVKIDDPQGESREVAFVVEEDSKLIKDGAAIAVSDLKEGDKVTVMYKLRDGKNVIVNLGVASRT